MAEGNTGAGLEASGGKTGVGWFQVSVLLPLGLTSPAIQESEAGTSVLRVAGGEPPGSVGGALPNLGRGTSTPEL